MTCCGPSPHLRVQHISAATRWMLPEGWMVDSSSLHFRYNILRQTLSFAFETTVKVKHLPRRQARYKKVRLNTLYTQDQPGNYTAAERTGMPVDFVSIDPAFWQYFSPGWSLPPITKYPPLKTRVHLHFWKICGWPTFNWSPLKYIFLKPSYYLWVFPNNKS